MIDLIIVCNVEACVTHASYTLEIGSEIGCEVEPMF